MGAARTRERAHVDTDGGAEGERVLTAIVRTRVFARPAIAGDEARLRSFECSSGVWYEDEVQEFVAERALSEVLDGGGSVLVDVPRPTDGTPTAVDLSEVWQPRLLLFFDDEELMAVAGHRPEMLNLGESRFILAVGLRVLALGNGYKGRRLDSGTRLSDAVMKALLNDVLTRTAAPTVLTAVAAIDNLRSVALCERHGLQTQIRHGHDHVRLIGHVEAAQG